MNCTLFSEVKNGNCLIKKPDRVRPSFVCTKISRAFYGLQRKKVKLVIFRYSSGEKEDP